MKQFLSNQLWYIAKGFKIFAGGAAFFAALFAGVGLVVRFPIIGIPIVLVVFCWFLGQVD